MTLAALNQAPSESTYCVAAANGCRSCDLLASMTVRSALAERDLAPGDALVVEETLVPRVIEVAEVLFPTRVVKSREFAGQVSCGDRRKMVASIARQVAENPPPAENS